MKVGTTLQSLAFVVLFINGALAFDCTPLKPSREVEADLKNRTEASANVLLKSLGSGDIKNEYERSIKNQPYGDVDEANRRSSFIFLMCELLNESKSSDQEKFDMYFKLIDTFSKKQSRDEPPPQPSPHIATTVPPLPPSGNSTSPVPTPGRPYTSDDEKVPSALTHVATTKVALGNIEKCSEIEGKASPAYTPLFNKKSVAIQNRSRKTLKVYWMSVMKGPLIYQPSLSSGAEFTIQSFVDALWKVTDENDNCISGFKVGPSGLDVIIGSDLVH
jgi:hypothetical protein